MDPIRIGPDPFVHERGLGTRLMEHYMQQEMVVTATSTGSDLEILHTDGYLVQCQAY